MKRILFGLAAITLASCGTKQPSETETTATEPTEVASSGPYEATSRSYCEEVEVGSHHYRLAISCEANKDQVVTDALDTRFYDNTITVSISEQGSELFSHTFTKADFEGTFDANHSILQGMAYSEYVGGKFILGAVVGEPGNNEGGNNYRVAITTSGEISITADDTQDTAAKN